MAAIVGTEEADTLTGGVEDDLITGLGGDDVLDGGDGIDRLEGGLGDDTYIVGETYREIDGIEDNWEDQVVEEAGAGVDTVIWMGIGGYRLGDNIENAVAGTRFANFFGNDLDNVLTGWTGTFDGNWTYGEGGDDTITGGDWYDTLSGGTGNDVLIGYAGGIAIDGVFDNDELDGGEGADLMIGGDGYDTYWADDLGDVIIELAPPESADGTQTYYYDYDMVYWTGQGAYMMPDQVDRMHLRGGADQALGNDQANIFFIEYGGYTFSGEPIGEGRARIDAGGGDDYLRGGSGDDELLGGDGADRIEGSDGLDTLRGGGGDDLLHGDGAAYFIDSNDTLFGDAGDDRIEGDSGDDVLDGGDGSDVLLGSWGNDRLTGGAGVDRFSFGQDDDVATDFTDGEDFILGEYDLYTITQDGADTLISHQGEHEWDRGTLRLVGVDATAITAADFVSQREGSSLDDDLTGDDEDDYVAGGDGNDDIDTGGGDDAGDGGQGDDDLDGGDGEDDLWGGTGDDVVDGGDDDDDISGGSGDDIIDGGSGEDDMSGGDGDDTYIVDDIDDEVWEDVDDDGGDDTVEASVDYTLGDGVEDLVLVDSTDAAGRLLAEAGRLDGTGNALGNRISGNAIANRIEGLAGDDSLSGGAGKDQLHGGAGADRLRGGRGDDVLAGGSGRDLLSGGGGADQFVLRDGERDRIVDFDAASGDRIVLRTGQANDFSDLTLTRDGNGGTIVGWSGGSIHLAGVQIRQVDASMFEFAQPARQIGVTDQSYDWGDSTLLAMLV